MEYSFKDKELDLVITKITGRFPERGYCANLISKELIYSIEGTGTLNFENEKVIFSKGDSILIKSNDKYYWDIKHCIVSMTCTLAWSQEQHKLFE